MNFRLADHNVVNYLVSKNVCPAKDLQANHIEPKSGKNFNLLVHSNTAQSFLVKQERYDTHGLTRGEFWNEWRLQAFLQLFPELEELRSHVSTPLYFDPEDSIIVFEYWNDYVDLSDFYDEAEDFPPAIAAQLGTNLAMLHKATYGKPEYKAALAKLSQDELTSQMPQILYGLERIGTEVFSRVRQDSLDFFRLYQRYESLTAAIAALKSSWNPSCLIHADLRLSNVLLHQDLKTVRVRLIDWEKLMWGEPAFDLGTLIAVYLRRWLNSLVVHRALDLGTMLRLARVPIFQLQPSLIALVRAYMSQFSDVFQDSPDFLERVLQFAGIVLIEKIVIQLEYHDPFNNTNICTLQVAKSLLCNPQQAALSIFAMPISELMK
jgi:Phosphotransferase enzyme family